MVSGLNADTSMVLVSEDTSWKMNDKDDMSGFALRAEAKTVHLSSASNTPCMEPPRGGWKAALELKGASCC